MKLVVTNQLQLLEEKAVLEPDIPIPPVPTQEDIPPVSEERNYTYRQTNRIYLRVEDNTCETYRRARALVKIFPGNVPVVFYYKNTGVYEKNEISRVNASPFVIEELQEICGDENVVWK